MTVTLADLEEKWADLIDRNPTTSRGSLAT
jgi:hypothetical protein